MDLLSQNKNLHSENALFQNGFLSEKIISTLNNGKFSHMLFSSGQWPKEKISKLNKELAAVNPKSFWETLPNKEFGMLIACIKKFADDLALPDTFKINLAQVIVDLTEIIRRNNLVEFKDRFAQHVEPQNANDGFGM